MRKYWYLFIIPILYVSLETRELRVHVQQQSDEQNVEQIQKNKRLEQQLEENRQEDLRLENMRLDRQRQDDIWQRRLEDRKREDRRIDDRRWEERRRG